MWRGDDGGVLLESVVVVCNEIRDTTVIVV